MKFVASPLWTYCNFWVELNAINRLGLVSNACKWSIFGSRNNMELSW